MLPIDPLNALPKRLAGFTYIYLMLPNPAGRLEHLMATCRRT